MSTNEQCIQELEYWFPYHYISTFKPDFSQCVVDDWGINYTATIELLLSCLADMKFDSIVDIGCGDGRFTREISNRFPASKVAGIDYSTRAIRLAAAMNFDRPDVEFMSCDISKTTNAQAFDAAILMEVLEHIPPDDAPGFVSATAKLLRPGGTLLLTVPHINKPLEPKHFRHFSGETVTHALSHAFKEIRIVPFERAHRSRKWIAWILANDVFALRHRKTLNRIYGYYKKNLVSCSSEKECQRLLVIAQART